MSAQQGAARQADVSTICLFIELLFIAVIFGVAGNSYWLGAGAAFIYIALHCVKQTVWIVYIASMWFWGYFVYNECGAHTASGHMAWGIVGALVALVIKFNLVQGLREQTGHDY
jgi:hypothetical protein